MLTEDKAVPYLWPYTHNLQDSMTVLPLICKMFKLVSLQETGFMRTSLNKK
jgi:hypothetical protein